MREILFRGKTSNGEWEYGVPVFSGLNNELAFMKQMHSYDHQVIPETVGQYTGLTDKNGTKIFEGDIIKNDYGYIGLIVFKACSYYIEWCSGNFTNDLYVMADNLEVVGNIHDNPELLKE